MEITFVTKRKTFVLSNCKCGNDHIIIEQKFNCEFTEGGKATLRIKCEKCGFITNWQYCLNELYYEWNERIVK